MHYQHAATTISLHFPSFPCVNSATVAASSHQTPHLHGKGLGHSPLCRLGRLAPTSLHLPPRDRELWGTHLPEAVQPRRHAPPSSLPSHGAAQPPGRRQAHQGSAALGGSSSPSPTPARAVAGTSCCHNPLVACSCGGKHLVQSLPSQTTSPPSSPARTHRAVETISASAFIKLPPVAVLQQELGRESSWAQAPKSGSAWG